MLRVAAPALLSVVLLSACGGGADTAPAAAVSSASPSGSPAAPPSPTGPPSLSKAAFLAAAEKICGDAVDTIESTPEPAGADELEDAIQTSLDTFTDTTSALDDLAAPQPDLAELEKIFLTPLREQKEEFEAFLPKFAEALGALTGDGESAKLLQELAALGPDAELSPEQMAQLEELSDGGGALGDLAELPEPTFVEPDLAAMKAYGFDRCVTLGDQEE